MKPVLLVDFGSTYTKVTGVDLDSESIIGTAMSHTTVDEDIYIGYCRAIESLSSDTGIGEWDRTYSCSSAAGGLKMIAVGFVPELTAEAAKRASLSAGAKVMKTYANILSDRELEEITALKPDILLLTGGTDGGDSKVLLTNAGKLAGLPVAFPVVVAGNKCAGDQVAAIMKAGGRQAMICDNVMPEINELNIDSAKAAIREIFLETIIRAKGLTKVEALVGEILMPTPTAVLSAAQLLAEGYEEEAGLGEVMVVDIGGATTDVHSVSEGVPGDVNVVFKGLEEPKLKRTVEGDLGMRYSARSLVESVGIHRVMTLSGLEKERVREHLAEIAESKDLLPEAGSTFEKMDLGLARAAVEASVTRHCGSMEVVYTPMGSVYQLNGKDLRRVTTVIGTGGPIVHSPFGQEILVGSRYCKERPMVLKPEDPSFYIDKKYIMAAMGLLSEDYPMTALRILKKELIDTANGEVIR